jgi:hypothetical protein
LCLLVKISLQQEQNRREVPALAQATFDPLFLCFVTTTWPAVNVRTWVVPMDFRDRLKPALNATGQFATLIAQAVTADFVTGGHPTVETGDSVDNCSEPS